MNFANPGYLWLLTLLPAWMAWAVGAGRRRARLWEALGQRGQPPRGRSAWLLAGAALLVIAMARPRFGPATAPPLPPGQDLMLVVDVSRSMGAEDAVPSRLAVAVESATRLVRALARGEGNRVGVVAFAGRGVLRCPLTANLGAAIEALERLRPGGVRPGGTDLGAGLDAALEAFGPAERAEGRTIVLFSDGEDHPGGWSSRLERLERAGVMVHAAAIGDAAEAHPIPSGQPGSEPLTFQGKPVGSRRVDASLETIAGRTGGAFLKLGLVPADLGQLYRETIAPVAALRRAGSRTIERPDQFPAFLATALSLVLGGCWPAGRRGPGVWGWRRGGGPGPGRRRAAGVILSLAFALCSSGAEPGPGDGPAEAVARGLEAYAAGDLPRALAGFEAAAAREPGSPVPRFNAGAVLYLLGRYDEAKARYIEASTMADSRLRAKIDFALGNTALRLGEIGEAIGFYDSCLASEANGTDVDGIRRDAAINRRFAIEQARSPDPSGEDAGQEPRGARRTRRRGPQDGDRPGATDRDGGGEGEGTPPEGGIAPGQDDDRLPEGRRRDGGAGGASSAPRKADPRSPDQRLQSALEQIREAGRRRLPDDPPPDRQDGDRKNW